MGLLQLARRAKDERSSSSKNVLTAQVPKVTVRSLRILLKSELLSTLGRKNVLISRLRKHYKSMKVIKLKKRLNRHTTELVRGKQGLVNRLIEEISSSATSRIWPGYSREFRQRAGSKGFCSRWHHVPFTQADPFTFDLLDYDAISRNSFLQEYIYRKVEELPALDGQNHSSKERVMNVQQWTDDHIKSCRAIPICGVPLQDFLPAQLFELSEVELSYVDDFSRPTLEELSRRDIAIDLRGNKLSAAIEGLSLAIGSGNIGTARGQAILTGMTHPIFELLAEKYKVLFKTLSLRDRQNKEDRIFLAGGIIWKVPQHRQVVVEEPDGDLENELPIASFISKISKLSEVSLNGSTVPTSSKILTGPSPTYYGEEIGTMLSQVSQNVKEFGMQDQETYTLSLIYTRLHISAAFFPQDLLLVAASGTNPILPADRYVYLVQSEEYELATQEGRREALQAVFALTKFWLSGRARVARLNKALSSIAGDD
ncbi:hypothetical protein BT69DRAFT_1303145 [Atractiella rhizophila]|nr:hypothetical protein BT69DRAFT_1303145 [Atractiella rhizophila]